MVCNSSLPKRMGEWVGLFDCVRPLWLINIGLLYLSLAECHRPTSPPLSPYSDCASPNDRRRQASPVLTPYSDTTSSSSDCDSETYRVPNATEKPLKKKRQRTTFSQHEKMQLEMAFRRQPYLMGNDEEMLAQRMGITVQNVRVSELKN